MNTGNPTFDLIPEWFWVLTVTLFGLAIGSFLNVVIYRVPKMYPDLPDEEDEDSSSTNKENKQDNKEENKDILVKEQIDNQKTPNEEEKLLVEPPKERNPNLPEDEKISLLYPKRSFCPNCGHNITALENIPVLSYVFLGGKCRGCKEKISLIYPFVEALTAVLFILAFYHQTTKPLFDIADYVANVVFISAIIALVFIDYNEMILPNVITLWGTVLSFIVRIFIPNEAAPSGTFLASLLSAVILILLFLLFAMLIFETRLIQLALVAGVLIVFCLGLTWLMQDPDKFFIFQDNFLYFWQDKIVAHPSVNSLINGILGAIIGAGSLMVMAGLYYVLRGIEGMGGGDFKMMLFVGMFLGWQLSFCTLLLAPALAMIPVTIILILKGSEAWQAKLPFGVFLGAGAIISLLFGKQIIEGYFQFAQRFITPY